MLNTRIYRTALLPALAAIAVLMFSLEPMPGTLPEPLSTPEFEAGDATRLARSIAASTPDRAPGSAGDREVAQMVEDGFREVVGGIVARQTIETKVDGEDATTDNVVLTIPGEREEAVLLVAARDTDEGSGAATSAAATATLLTITDAIGNSRHERTLVLASTSASGDGAEGIRELTDGLDLPGEIRAAVVISQPGLKASEPPFVYGGRAGDEYVPPALIETADEIATQQFEQDSANAGAWTGLARLAIPFGVGGASALVEEGIPAVAVSGGGERPAEPSEAEAVSGKTMFKAGTTALDLLLTLDGSRRPIAEGPREYVQLGSNFIPGWTFKLLALALILPSLLTAIDIWVRDRRRNARPVRRSVGWTLERILVPLAAVLAAYLLGLVGLIPGPSFPYDPGGVDAGVSVPVALGVMLGAAVLAAILIRPMRTPLDSEPQTLAGAAGILTCAGLLGIWLLNPYMALLLTPAAHVWLVPARASGPPKGRRIALLGLVSLLPAIGALVAVGLALDLGIETPWHLVLMLVDGFIGPVYAFLWCLVIGGLIAAVGAAGAAKPPEIGTSRSAPRSIRGPAGHAGPGALGGTPSSLFGR